MTTTSIAAEPDEPEEPATATDYISELRVRFMFLGVRAASESLMKASKQLAIVDPSFAAEIETATSQITAQTNAYLSARGH